MPWRATIAASTLLLWSATATSIDRIVVEAEGMVVAGTTVEAPRVELDLSGETPRLALTVRRASMSQPAAVRLDEVRVTCAEIVIHEPHFACRDGQLSARGGPTGAIAMRVATVFDSERAVLDFEGSGLAVAGGSLQVAATLDSMKWSARGRAQGLRIGQIRSLASPWFSVPKQYSLDGRLEAQIEASGSPGTAHLRLDARSADLDFSNEAGSVVAQKVALRLRADARQSGGRTEIETTLDGSKGQALAGPVLLDFGANPLKVVAKGRMSEGAVQLEDVAVTQRNLLTARGKASLHLAGKPLIRSAHADITSIQFPAAYTSFLQIALAATDFGTLEASGSASGAIRIADDAVTQLELRMSDVDLVDERTQFFMNDVQGELHWAPAGAAVAHSNLAWSKMRAYGLSGGTAQLSFRAQGTDFELTREARLPVFDGAMVVHSLAARGLGGDAAELNFDADIEPISMALLSKAFGWPQLAGQLSGRIPGLTYRNKVLEFNGDVTAHVFDGAITGRNFRLQDPLGPWPRLFADVQARRLDLQLVTSTFSIGSITGRLDADLKHLELFNWSPVAFDARLYSTPDDRSPRRISQKAVNSISSIGGGTSGVTQALQSGVLRFFQEFSYDRIGIACQLRNEVCLMSGVEPRGAGYYLVKGRGLPRIDIIGNQGRVDWPQLLSQIITGMQSEGPVVR